MKRLIPLFLLCITLICGCSKGVSDIKVTSFDIVSLTPQGLSAVDAVMDVGIDNPLIGFTLSDIKGIVKMDGTPCMTITSQPVTLEGKSDKVYRIPLTGVLSGAFNPFQLLDLVKDKDLSRFKVDATAKVILPGGISKNLEFKDLAVEKLLNSQLP